jgi:hypothetical protein
MEESTKKDSLFFCKEFTCVSHALDHFFLPTSIAFVASPDARAVITCARDKTTDRHTLG